MGWWNKIWRKIKINHYSEKNLGYDERGKTNLKLTQYLEDKTKDQKGKK